MQPREVIHQVLQDWAPEFVQNRIEGARSADLVASQDLVKSMRSEVTSALKEVQSFFFQMEAYGRILDMRGVNRARQVPIDEIKEWIEDVGIGKFRSGFARRNRVPEDRNQLLNQIAWGIAIKRQQKKRFKRRRWYSKAREEDFDTLYQRLMDALAENTLTDIKQATQ